MAGCSYVVQLIFEKSGVHSKIQGFVVQQCLLYIFVVRIES